MFHNCSLDKPSRDGLGRRSMNVALRSIFTVLVESSTGLARSIDSRTCMFRQALIVHKSEACLGQRSSINTNDILDRQDAGLAWSIRYLNAHGTADPATLEYTSVLLHRTLRFAVFASTFFRDCICLVWSTVSVHQYSRLSRQIKEISIDD
jgi:hypothetical protein